MLILPSTAPKVLFAKVPQQMNTKEGGTMVSLQENSGLELHNFGGLTTAWLGLYECDKRHGPEAHGQESEPKR